MQVKHTAQLKTKVNGLRDKLAWVVVRDNEEALETLEDERTAAQEAIDAITADLGELRTPNLLLLL